jgi:hypothetical protein
MIPQIVLLTLGPEVTTSTSPLPSLTSGGKSVYEL